AGRHEREVAVAQALRDATGLAVESEDGLEHNNVRDLEHLLSSYRAHTGAEVAVVDRQGRVVDVDTDHDDDALTIDRGKVLAALRGRPESSIREDEGSTSAVAAVPVDAGSAAVGAVLVSSPVGNYTDQAQDIWTALAAFAAGVLVLTAIVGLLMARSLSRPLGALEQAVSELGEGRLTRRAAVDRGPPEMQDLARRFNEMADRLEQLITAQSRFVADASHQLRSPLTALRLRLENLEAELDAEQGEALAAAGREVQRLSRLVDGLLVLTRTESDAPEVVPVDVDRLVLERCEAWEALADERRIHLVCVRADRPVPVPLVPGDLEQILDNLVANALDASPAGSTITVNLESDRGSTVTLHVVDQGPGLGEEERRRAFDRFWQGPGRRGGHSGLGLAIVRQLAQRNRLSVELRPGPDRGLDAVVQMRTTPARPADGRGPGPGGAAPAPGGAPAVTPGATADDRS
ncbi:MAG TPA: HAMP domain-containing sensor histidine kinase, partial [Acidimicrobiales bacterium]|nr:HAMP domain-containing sensor histidine kinase [Acidimicrobiales bacterium]